MKASCGFTLVELLLVLVLLGLLAGVVGLTIHTAKPIRDADAVSTAIVAERDLAIRSGRSVTITLVVNNGQHSVTADPNGRVVSDSALEVNALTGVRNDFP